MSEGCPREVVYELRCRYAENMRARVAELEKDKENMFILAKQQQARVAELEARLQKQDDDNRRCPYCLSTEVALDEGRMLCRDCNEGWSPVG